jgi:Fe2+ or Zn2+ uptake regulation protein
MAQDKIFKLLKELKIKGKSYYSVREIYNILKDKKEDLTISSINKNLGKMALFGLVDYKFKGLFCHRKFYRAK